MSKKPTAKEATTTAATDHAQAPVNARLTPEERIELFRKMVRIRRFEERSLRAYQAKKIGGFLHLYIGQEAVAVGCCSLMGPTTTSSPRTGTTGTRSRSGWTRSR